MTQGLIGAEFLQVAVTSYLDVGIVWRHNESVLLTCVYNEDKQLNIIPDVVAQKSLWSNLVWRIIITDISDGTQKSPHVSKFKLFGTLLLAACVIALVENFNQQYIHISLHPLEHLLRQACPCVFLSQDVDPLLLYRLAQEVDGCFLDGNL